MPINSNSNPKINSTNVNNCFLSKVSRYVSNN